MSLLRFHPLHPDNHAQPEPQQAGRSTNRQLRLATQTGVQVKNLVDLAKRGSVGDLAMNKHEKALCILCTYCTPGTSGVSISDPTHWLLWEAGRNVPIHIKLLGHQTLRALRAIKLLELSDLTHTQICLAFNLLSPGP